MLDLILLRLQAERQLDKCILLCFTMNSAFFWSFLRFWYEQSIGKQTCNRPWHDSVYLWRTAQVDKRYKQLAAGLNRGIHETWNTVVTIPRQYIADEKITGFSPDAPAFLSLKFVTWCQNVCTSQACNFRIPEQKQFQRHQTHPDIAVLCEHKATRDSVVAVRAGFYTSLTARRPQKCPKFCRLTVVKKVL